MSSWWCENFPKESKRKLWRGSCISRWPVSCIMMTVMVCLLTWVYRCLGFVTHPQLLSKKCLTRFLHSPSNGSICEPHGPAAGLSHAPSAQAAQARGSSHNPSPAGSAKQPSLPPRFWAPASLALRLAAWLPGCLRAWIPVPETPAVDGHRLNPHQAHANPAPAAPAFGGQHAPVCQSADGVLQKPSPATGW